MLKRFASTLKSFDEQLFLISGIGVLILNAIPTDSFDPIFADAWRQVFPGPTLFTLVGVITMIAAFIGFKTRYFNPHRQTWQKVWLAVMLVGFITNGYVFWTAVGVLAELNNTKQSNINIAQS